VALRLQRGQHAREQAPARRQVGEHQLERLELPERGHVYAPHEPRRIELELGRFVCVWIVRVVRPQLRDLFAQLWWELVHSDWFAVLACLLRGQLRCTLSGLVVQLFGFLRRAIFRLLRGCFRLLLGVHRLRQQQRAGEQRDDEQAQQTNSHTQR